MKNSHHSHRLLIVTQKVDIDDPILGFFHKWIGEFAQKFEKVSVICLEKGEYNLPENVSVYSLGKEVEAKSYKLKAKTKYLFNFYKYIWKLRHDYDSVFVHMNQEYVVLGWDLWKLWSKKIFLWRNHPKGNFFTNIAVLVSNRVFCTSPDAYVARFKKTRIVPVGIDVEKFKVQSPKFNIEEKKNKILFLSRMSPIKRPEILIKALNLLNEEGIKFEANFYGDPLPKDKKYYESLKDKIRKYGLGNCVNFYKGVKNSDTIEIYSKHNIFVNLTPSGSMDKTILEAGLCGCIPVVSNNYFGGIFDDEMITSGEPKDLKEKLKYWINADKDEMYRISGKIVEYIKQNHSLDILIRRLKEEING